MKKITTIFVLFVLLTSCTKQYIQLFEVGTTNTQLKNESYVSENDTLKITYSFWASKGILSFSIYNKLDKPVYIDWKNSSMIYNDKTINYWVNAEPIYISNQYNSVYFYKYSMVEFGFPKNPRMPNSSALEVKPERITVIPPKSHYDRAQFCVLPVENYEIDLNCPTNVVPRNDKPKKKTTVYSEEYTYENSPVKLRNHVAFSCSENTLYPSFVDHTFFLASAREMELRHYLGKPTGYDKNQNFIFTHVFRNKTSFYINIPEDKTIANRKLNERKMYMPAKKLAQ